MSKLPKKRAIQWRIPLAAAATGAVLSALALYLTATILLPRWVEHTLDGMLSKLAGARSVSYESIRINLFSAEIDRLNIAQGTLPPLRLESCSVKYTPLSLLRGHLKRISVSGIEINFSVKEGRLLLEGKDGLKLHPSDLLRALGSMPFSIDRIETRDAWLNFQEDKLAILIPVKMTLTPMDSDWSRATASIEAAPNGQRIKASVNFAKDNPRITARIWTPKPLRLEALPLGRIAATSADLSGDIELEARAAISADDMTLEKLEADVRSERLRLRCGRINMSGSAASLKLRHKGGKGSLEISGLRLEGECPAELKSVKSEYAISDGSITASSEISLAGGAKGSPLKAPASVAVEAKASFKDFAPQEAWATMRIAGDAQTIELETRGVSLSVKAPSLEVRTTGEGMGFNASIRLPQLKATAHGVSATAKELSIAAKGSAGGALHFDATLSDGSLRYKQATVEIPGLTVSGDWQSETLSGMLQGGKISATEGVSGAGIEGLSIRLPFKFPLANGVPPGELAIKNITLKNLQLGSLSATLSPDAKGLAAKGRFIAAKFMGLAADFEGACLLLAGGEISSNVKFSMPPFKFEEPIDLGMIHPKGKGVMASGTVALKGSLSSDGHSPSGVMTATVKDAALKDAQGLYSIEGLNAKMTLPDLPAIRSATGQEITFAKAQAGNISLSDGRIAARLDGPCAIFVEDFKAACLGGKLSSQAFSCKPGAESHSLTLRFDRISIAEFLCRIGAGRAEGEGSINGSIPLSIKDGGISFHDAFLYSTPGESGTIRLDDNGLLMLSLQDSVSDSKVLDLARATLKDYSYSWAKISMDTKGDIVAVKLQFDGKPRGSLPYRMDDDGRYIYDHTGKFVFQGIRMDLNFNIPLAKVLGVGGNLKNILNTGNQ